MAVKNVPREWVSENKRHGFCNTVSMAHHAPSCEIPFGLFRRGWHQYTFACSLASGALTTRCSNSSSVASNFAGVARYTGSRFLRAIPIEQHPNSWARNCHGQTPGRGRKPNKRTTYIWCVLCGSGLIHTDSRTTAAKVDNDLFGVPYQ